MTPTYISKWLEVSRQSTPHTDKLFAISTQPSYSFPSPSRDTIFILAVEHAFPMHGYPIHSARVGIAPILLALMLYRSQGWTYFNMCNNGYTSAQFPKQIPLAEAGHSTMVYPFNSISASLIKENLASLTDCVHEVFACLYRPIDAPRKKRPRSSPSDIQVQLNIVGHGRGSPSILHHRPYMATSGR